AASARTIHARWAIRWSMARLWTRPGGAASLRHVIAGSKPMRVHSRRAVVAALVIPLLRIMPVSAAEPTPFKVGLSENVNTALAIWMAEEAGFYKAAGLKVE